MTADEARDLPRSKHLVVRNLVSDPVRSFLYEYALRSELAGKLKSGDPNLPNTPCAYADPFMEWLLEAQLPSIEAATGLSLHPTYSYLRVYRRNDILHRHTDRPSCETSVTLSLGYDAEEPWPIWIEVEGEPRSIQLGRGDALVYPGIDVPHWREAYAGEQAVQVFLHYVDRTGPHRDWALDRRQQLGISPAARRVMEALSGSASGGTGTVLRESR